MPQTSGGLPPHGAPEECLSNIHRHSGSQTATIRISREEGRISRHPHAPMQAAFVTSIDELLMMSTFLESAEGRAWRTVTRSNFSAEAE